MLFDANWMIAGKMIKGMGGTMDLVAGVTKIVVVMEHTSRNGEARFIPECTLPLTGKSVIDMVITDLCLFQRVNHDNPFKLAELVPGMTPSEVAMKTSGTIWPEVADDRYLRPMLRRKPVRR